MLSVCIPVYRYDVRPLVRELLRQAEEVGQALEILVYDDASPGDGDWGQAELRSTPGIRYVELPENLGRAAIRNKMAREASQEFVAMLDADGALNPNWLRDYLTAVPEIQFLTGADDATIMIVGGRNYAPEPPPEPALHLHWWYGTQRESQVDKDDWNNFHSNNFLTRRDILLAYPFPEDGSGYGHEDTLWGQQQYLAKTLLFGLENPVIHLGLEPNDVFLGKQREAIRNLALLRQRHPHLRTRLLDLADYLPWLRHVVRLLPESTLVRYLTRRARPSLYALDLLKLKWWFADSAGGNKG